MYTNLGEDGILHAMNETGCSVVVTSHDLMPKFERLLGKLPHVTHLVYFEVGRSDISYPLPRWRHRHYIMKISVKFPYFTLISLR